MKVGELCWVFEGSVKSFLHPVVFLGTRTYDRGDKIDSYRVALQDGGRLHLSLYFYTLVPVSLN